MRSNYIVAGFESLATILDNFLLEKKGRFDNQFTRDNISNFFKDTCGGFLHSFGQNFKGKKKYHKYIEQEGNLYRKCRQMGLFNDSHFYIDSGGFQISVGVLNRKETNTLFDLYYKFLVEQYEVYDRAFILDVPPGPNCSIFHDFHDVYDFNLRSYNTARNLPQHVKDKIVYIHHFRTPELWRIFSDILHKDNMFNDFKHHGTGGIVANAASDAQIPCLIYVLPLIPLINQAKKYNRTTLNFHVLGGANFRDVLIYELFRKHILDCHSIELNITYDSSGLFKGLMIGRRLFIYDNGIVKKLDLRTNNLHLRYKHDMKITDIVERSVDNTCIKHNLKLVPKPFEIYSKESGTFHEDVKVYLMLQSLDLYSIIQEEMRNLIEGSYYLYKTGNIKQFNEVLSQATQNLNDGKITKKQATKTYSMSRSLDILTNLDEDYCKFIVDKFLSKDEFTNLLNDKRVMCI